MVKADKTGARPDIDLDLKRFNRSNLPVNIIVPEDPEQPLIMMPELFGVKETLEALDKAAGKAVATAN